jgi:lysophospholipase L1-like esterase
MASLRRLPPTIQPIPIVLCLLSLVGVLAGGGKAPLHYLALGDSYTIGEGVPPHDRWPVQLASLLRQQGIAVGEPQIIARTGWTVADLDAGIDAAAPQARPDRI